ncbi:uncharacterized protein LOC131041100 [Cryptomeria japonica]|uniref:uncharacterized protein LOC131041100 n=1 Tax=Cryptomeria japonica TaxID=3369 RepID=UPI0025AC3D6D|nr:uncharacterized protein LOC131041100 [Cryptomeria japonica]
MAMVFRISQKEKINSQHTIRKKIQFFCLQLMATSQFNMQDRMAMAASTIKIACLALLLILLFVREFKEEIRGAVAVNKKSKNMEFLVMNSMDSWACICCSVSDGFEQKCCMKCFGIADTTPSSNMVQI